MISTFSRLITSAGYGNMSHNGRRMPAKHLNGGDHMNKKRYYLAYGSNLNRKQMEMRCPGAKVVGTALLEGYELLFKGSKTGF